MGTPHTSEKAVVIGSGFAGLSAACFLARDGKQVTLLEKNATPGGRARAFSENGFTFDMGPSWYWMPDVFESFFQQFGKSTSDYYQLRRLDPGYGIFFGPDDVLDVPATMPELERLFESLEPGSSVKLRKFLREAEYKYRVGMSEFVYKPALSVREFLDIRLLASAFRLNLIQSLSSHVRALFRHPRLIQLLEFPVLFLGATPQKTPALYSLMNYADLVLGTWYPDGGMIRVIEGMVALARELGVQIEYQAEVTAIDVQNGKAIGVRTANSGYFEADFVIGGADYHHIETELLPSNCRSYSDKYWASRTLAPSSLMFYLGIGKKLDAFRHHSLFFDRDFEKHAREIYETPQWPTEPLLYTSCTSKTDSNAAPPGCENLVVLIPVAPGLEDTPATREKYYQLVMDRLEHLTGQSIRAHVRYRRDYAHSDFQRDYHAFRGNAYGLANTLTQTAIFKPRMKSKKVENLYFTGQLTVPGPGVPPSIISGQVVASLIAKLKTH